MPNLAPKLCTYPGCRALVSDGTGRCGAHKRVEARLYDKKRGSANDRGYTSKWQRASKFWLAKHPLCQCEQCQGGLLRVTPATVVDHRIPHKGDMRLFWDSSNWQSMAKPCHDRKTAMQDGGLGRGVKISTDPSR